MSNYILETIKSLKEDIKRYESYLSVPCLVANGWILSNTNGDVFYSPLVVDGRTKGAVDWHVSALDATGFSEVDAIRLAASMKDGNGERTIKATPRAQAVKSHLNSLVTYVNKLEALLNK